MVRERRSSFSIFYMHSLSGLIDEQLRQQGKPRLGSGPATLYVVVAVGSAAQDHGLPVHGEARLRLLAFPRQHRDEHDREHDGEDGHRLQHAGEVPHPPAVGTTRWSIAPNRL